MTFLRVTKKYRNALNMWSQSFLLTISLYIGMAWTYDRKKITKISVEKNVIEMMHLKYWIQE